MLKPEPPAPDEDRLIEKAVVSSSKTVKQREEPCFSCLLIHDKELTEFQKTR